MMLRFLQRKEEAFITAESIKSMEVPPMISPKKRTGNELLASMVSRQNIDDKY
jgi:hypothetical protein